MVSSTGLHPDDTVRNRLVVAVDGQITACVVPAGSPEYPSMADHLSYGLFAINMGPGSQPSGAVRLARAAEAAGFDSLWAGEHVVMPDPRTPQSMMEPDEPILDPLIAFAFLAGQTTTIRFGTGIIILPQRNPLVLAKEVASLDALSGGRLTLGLGVGYLEPEFRALGIPFPQRGARADDYLAAMRAIWEQEHPAHDGPFFSFAGVQAAPRPHHLPIVFGGESLASYRRSVASADGWYGFSLDVDGARAAIAGLREMAGQVERPAGLGRLEISVTPRGIPSRDEALQYADLGVDRLILWPQTDLDEEDVLRIIDQVGTELIGRT